MEHEASATVLKKANTDTHTHSLCQQHSVSNDAVSCSYFTVNLLTQVATKSILDNVTTD